MTDRTPDAIAADLLPDNPNNQRAAVRDLERAVASGWDIDPELARAIQTRIKQWVYGVDAQGNRTGKSPGPRTLQRLGMLAVNMQKLANEEKKAEQPGANVTVPITPEQLSRMSDEELAAVRSNLRQIVQGKG